MLVGYLEPILETSKRRLEWYIYKKKLAK
jgi:hypothetical protein